MMSFGRRQPAERRDGQRHDVSRQAALYFGDDNLRVNGLVKNVSRNGALFVIDLPMNLPREVVLQFWNGDKFGCDVVRDVGGTEFGLQFKDVRDFDQSHTGRCIDSIQNFTTNQTPYELFQLTEGLDFFGDEEIERVMKRFIASYEELVNICSERILPPTQAWLPPRQGGSDNEL